MIFDWWNKFATDGLFNIFEFDFMTYKKTIVKEKCHKTFSEMSMGSHLTNRKWLRYLENWDSSDINNHLVDFEVI